MKGLYGAAASSVMARLKEHEEKLSKLQEQVLECEQAEREVFTPPSKEWIKRKVANLKEIIQKRTAQSAFLIRRLFGDIILTPVTGEDVEEYLQAKTKLQTISLLNDPDLGAISSQWWRWRESNPRPRSFSVKFLHV